MGIDYRTVLMVGKCFGYEQEAVDWLESKGLEFSEEDFEDGLAEFLDSDKSPHDITGTILNFYSGYGFVLGYDLTLHDPANFGKQYQELFDKFKSSFGDDPEIVNEVMVY